MVLEKAQLLDLSANQFVNLAVANALSQMDANVPEPNQFIRNYRRITGRELPPVSGALWSVISTLFPTLQSLRKRNQDGTEPIFLDLWYRLGGCETEEEAKALWQLAVQRWVNKLAKEQKASKEDAKA